MADESLSRRLAWAGAWLFAVGMVTGVWAAIVLTERVVVQLPRLALAAHLNALLGGLWLIAVAATVDMLRYVEHGRPIQLVESTENTHSVDVPEDVAVVERMLAAAR